MTGIHPPYVWFGGKRRVAPLVWDALGDVDHYVEPFFGGGSVWLLRPHAPRLETVNDYDGFVANFWRAVQAEPESVAEAMNWPVNEVDLEARHRSLCRMPDKAEFLERMKHDPRHYDVERAAWWCWGLNAWIASGWCGGEYWPDHTGKSRGTGVCDGANKLPHLGSAGQGVHRKLPHLGSAGRGVHRQLPHLGSAGQGVHRKLPHLGSAGLGVHRKLPHLGDAGRGETDRRGIVLRDWMCAIRDRLRNVRVCCGDWARVCTNGATAHGKTVGIFLDPPYSFDKGNRCKSLYRHEDGEVAHRVREYCLSRTEETRYRIILAGYNGEHNELEDAGWRVVAWKATGGYANIGTAQNGKANAHRERLWFSPSCLGSSVPEEADMFALEGAR